MNPEKKSRYIYWALTAPLLVIMLMEGITMLAGASIFVNGMKTLGYPAYICRILGAAKLLGSIAILQNRSRMLKEWAYAGFTFIMLGAAASHTLHGDDFARIISPVFILIVVLASYRQWKKMQPSPSKQPFFVEENLA